MDLSDWAGWLIRCWYNPAIGAFLVPTRPLISEYLLDDLSRSCIHWLLPPSDERFVIA